MCFEQIADCGYALSCGSGSRFLLAFLRLVQKTLFGECVCAAFRPSFSGKCCRVKVLHQQLCV
jgi:hypothetical protein